EGRVLAQRELQAAKRDRGEDQDRNLKQLVGPAGIGDEHREQHDGPADRQAAAVQRDDPVRRHAPFPCTAAARSRIRRSAAGSPPDPSASTRALPTTTPSASWAVARACAGVLMPNPTASGSGLAARTRATCSAKSGGTRSRAPVTPRREIR